MRCFFILILGLWALCGCKSTTTIQTEEKATIMEKGSNRSLGMKQAVYNDYKTFWGSTTFIITKDGCEKEYLTIKRTDNIQGGRIFWGFFSFFPWLWLGDYEQQYAVDLNCPKEMQEYFKSSVQTNYANEEFGQTVGNGLSKKEAWNVVSQTVTNYFDNLKMADFQTGYMKTAWEARSFRRATIRTRVIVTQNSSNPLKYQIKIVSEIADESSVNVDDAQAFEKWDRILRQYDGIIDEFQARLN